MGTPPVMSPLTSDAPHDGGPFGRHAAMWLFHLKSKYNILRSGIHRIPDIISFTQVCLFI